MKPVIFIGSKRAYVSFQQQYALSSKMTHVTRFEQLQGMHNMNSMIVLYDKTERDNPTWKPLIDFATRFKYENDNPYVSAKERDGYTYRSKAAKNMILSKVKPNCLWCGKEFQTNEERDKHEEICGD